MCRILKQHNLRMSTHLHFLLLIFYITMYYILNWKDLAYWGCQTHKMFKNVLMFILVPLLMSCIALPRNLVVYPRISTHLRGTGVLNSATCRITNAFGGGFWWRLWPRSAEVFKCWKGVKICFRKLCRKRVDQVNKSFLPISTICITNIISPGSGAQ